LNEYFFVLGSPFESEGDKYEKNQKFSNHFNQGSSLENKVGGICARMESATNNIDHSRRHIRHMFYLWYANETQAE